jgi:hypothetical protein
MGRSPHFYFVCRRQGCGIRGALRAAALSVQLATVDCQSGKAKQANNG